LRSMNTTPNIDACPSIHSTAFQAAIPFHLQWLLDPVNHALIHIICPTIMNNTKSLTMWLRQHQY
jgi:hypothetical protein